MPDNNLGQIITFYSYKGGTGRSMALANAACILADRREGRVLAIDWDLEAPGLHRYFQDLLHSFLGNAQTREQQGARVNEQVGVIDLFETIVKKLDEHSLPEEPEPEAITAFFQDIAIQNYIIQTDRTGLFFMKAGRFDDDYAKRISSFSWEKFYYRAPWLISALAQYLSEQFQFVLIDSRTGHTDSSGITTMLMPDKLVTVFTPNEQSISGVIEHIKRAVRYRHRSNDLRPLVVFPLASRVDFSERVRREYWRFGDDDGFDGYERRFADVFKQVYELSDNESRLGKYFDDTQIPHIAAYSYGEEIAYLKERATESLSLGRFYQDFTDRLLQLSVPWQNLDELEDVDDTPDEDDLVSHTGQELPASTARVRHFKIFLSSPGDVAEERYITRKLIEDLQYTSRYRGRVTLEVVAWETVTPATPMTPQEAINEGLSKPSEADIVIVILWSRMGTPLPDSYRMPDGRPYLSGTEWEFEEAMRTSRQFGRPQVLVYRRTEVIKFPVTERNLLQKVEQWNRVSHFFDSLVDKDGVVEGAYNSYAEPNEFRALLESHLVTLIDRLLAESLKVEAPSSANTQKDIFISYRRSYAAHAGRIYDRLEQMFGHENIFMDIVSLEPGVDFQQAINRALASTKVMMVLIGPDWVNRLDNPDDFVRREIRDGLQRGIRVIPVLLDDTPMPHRYELPEDIQRLPYFQSVKVRSTEFNRDMQELLRFCERALKD